MMGGYHTTLPATMLGTILAGCTTAHAAMWTVTTVLRLTLIVVLIVQLKRE